MFDSVIEYTKRLEKSIEGTKQDLHKLYGARRRIDNSIAKAQDEISRFDNPEKYVKSLEPKIEVDSKQLAKNTLFTTALRATAINKEFSHPIYFKYLSDVIDDDATYRVAFRGSGWNKIVSVSINLDTTGGRLTDWGRAIKQFREQLYQEKKAVKPRRSDYAGRAQMDFAASKAWARIYATGGSKLAQTIEGRLSYTSKKAPFWQILDKGTVSLPSDRGGFPTPENTSTNFVNEAQVQVNQQLKTYIQSLRSTYEELVNSIKKEMSALNVRREEISEIIDQVKFDIQESSRVKQGLGKIGEYTDDTKLTRAIQLAKQGLEGTVNVGIPGIRKRITYRRIRSLL